MKRTRRAMLAGLTGTGVTVAGFVFGSGAFTRTQSNRDVTLSVVQDEAAFLELSVNQNLRSDVIQSDGQIGFDAQSANPNATLTVGAVETVEFDTPGQIVKEAFTVTNHGTAAAEVALSFDGNDPDGQLPRGKVLLSESLSQSPDSARTDADDRATVGLDSNQTAVAALILETGQSSESISATLRVTGDATEI